MITTHPTATGAWYDILTCILGNGNPTSPRGEDTLEVLHRSVAFDMNYPVIICPPRKLSYKFMAAEAYWMLAGDNTVDGIAPYNQNIAKFSDDGKTFSGAYGPHINDQIPYVLSQLLCDEDTRQAVLTIWQPNPEPSKDIPCTVAMTFNIRGGRLNCHVFMRSSDAWLGIPYDFFNYTMVAVRLVGALNALATPGITSKIGLGNLYWTGVSSHLYERNINAAAECVDYFERFSDRLTIPDGVAVPVKLYTSNKASYGYLMNSLIENRDGTLDEASFWRIRP